MSWCSRVQLIGWVFFPAEETTLGHWRFSRNQPILRKTSLTCFWKFSRRSNISVKLRIYSDISEPTGYHIYDSLVSKQKNLIIVHLIAIANLNEAITRVYWQAGFSTRDLFPASECFLTIGNFLFCVACIASAALSRGRGAWSCAWGLLVNPHPASLETEEARLNISVTPSHMVTWNHGQA